MWHRLGLDSFCTSCVLMGISSHRREQLNAGLRDAKTMRLCVLQAVIVLGGELETVPRLEMVKCFVYK